jgi:hypothetical protein
MRPYLFIAATCAASLAIAQCDRWQQHIECDLSVDLDVRTHRFTGVEKLVYVNHSPDTLRELYFHLYFNAFRPGSEMDVRSRTISDPDPRVGDRIAALMPGEVGELRCSEMTQDHRSVGSETLGTVLRATLAKPVFPGKRTTLRFNFNGQVPVQIRRSGRDNAEGIAYSMTQWFPKVAVYDERGWHADPYVGREFYGEWGDYDVRIVLDSSFTVAATGVLQNADEIGHGYARRTRRQKRADGKLMWHFKAPRVHDFAWSADPDYKQVTAQVPHGPLLRFIHEDRPELEEAWKQLPSYMVRSFEYMNAHFGKYPYPEFTFAQGGDGGMEYPMMTLITGRRHLGSLVGTAVHESIHNWYYGVLGSDEGSHPWMDEGFDEYAGSEVMRSLFSGQKQDRVHQEAVDAYLRFVPSPDHEPMSVHADHFTSNRAYSVDAYTMGEVLLDQLGAVIGDSTLHRGLLRYFKTCGFHHPGPVDVQRVMEKESGLQLGWYFNEWINTVRQLDYAVKDALPHNDSISVILERKGEMLMPTDVAILGNDGSVAFLHIPLSLELGARKEQPGGAAWSTLPPWQWTDPTYTFTIPAPASGARRVEIDPFGRLGDVDRKNDSMFLRPGPEEINAR